MNELQKKEGTALAVQTRGHGFEEVELEDLILPRIKLCQGLTSEVTDGLATVGDFINSISKKNYGKLIAIVPIKFLKSYIEWGDKKKNEPNIKNISYDGKFWVDGTVVEKDDPRLRFGVDGSKPTITKYMQFPSIILGDEDQALPSFFSFSSTSVKEGKILLNIAMMKGGNLFDYIYPFRSEAQRNEKGTYQVPRLELNGIRASAPELRSKAASLLNLLEQTKTITFHVEAEAEDGEKI